MNAESFSIEDLRSGFKIEEEIRRFTSWMESEEAFTLWLDAVERVIAKDPLNGFDRMAKYVASCSGVSLRQARKNLRSHLEQRRG